MKKSVKTMSSKMDRRGARHGRQGRLTGEKPSVKSREPVNGGSGALPAAKYPAKRRAWLLAQCERVRQECNGLTEKENRRNVERALQIIYGTNGTSTTGCR